MTDVELVARADHRVGEGPLWHPDEACLYWVDIPTGRLFRHDPRVAESPTSDGETSQRGRYSEVLSLDRTLGGATLQTDGSLALFTGRGGVALWDGPATVDDEPTGAAGSTAEAGETDHSVEYLIDELPGEADTRFNDVVTDPEGRVFAGTMPTESELGTLYRVDPDGSVAVAADRGFDVPNGMDFAPDHDALYVTESEARTIHRYEYDRATGALGERTTFARVSEGGGLPDGLTVDAAGHVWSARWDGNEAVRHAPDGAVVERIDLPAPKVAAPAFGGPDLTDLYLTTAKGHDAEDAPPAGSVFRARPGVAGRAGFRSRIGLENGTD